MGEVIAGRYELVDLLDSGGAGSVWRVWDHRDADYRAAKILRQSDSDSLLRFVQETSRRIDHPHVVAPYGWSGEDDRVLFTMPLVEGGSLAQLLADHGALPPGWAGELTGQALDALVRIHEMGLVHRDVKPGNLLLDATGTGTPHLRLSDFGAAAQVGGPRLTLVGTVIGTPGYLAPEQAGGAEPDPAQDVYALGVVLRQLLSGVAPRGGGALPEGPRPAGVPGARLWELSSAMTAAEPADRPSAADALAQLDSVPGSRDLALGADPTDPVEVFCQLPPLPEGWGPAGPTGTGPTGTAPSSEADPISETAPTSEPPPARGRGPERPSPPATRLIREEPAATEGRSGPGAPARTPSGVPAAAWVLAVVGVVLLVLALVASR